jgi:hypothetical protein
MDGRDKPGHDEALPRLVAATVDHPANPRIKHRGGNGGCGWVRSTETRADEQASTGADRPAW